MTDKNKSLISIIVPFSFFTAACWHLPYWATFDINPFEYMGLNDIIMSFIYPLVFSILGFLVPANIGYLFGPFLRTPERNKEIKELKKELDKKDIEVKKDEIIVESQTEIVEETKPIEEEIPKQKKNGFWHFLSKGNTYLFLFKLSLCVSLAYTLIFCEPDTKWNAVPPIMQLILFMWIWDNEEKYEEYFPKGYRNGILIFTTLVLTTTIINSRQRSLNIRDEKSYDYIVDLTISNERLKVLGKLGDYMLLTSMGNKSIYIVPLGSKNCFEIKHFNSK